MILDQSLDKLRNKELSFGCVVKQNADEYAAQGLPTLGSYGMTWRYCCKRHNEQCSIDEILGHPLTRGRICYLLDEYFRDPLTKNDAYVTLSIAKRKIGGFLAYYQLYDQNELQRMNHEKRPELKELLIQFSNYIQPENDTFGPANTRNDR